MLMETTEQAPAVTEKQESKWVYWLFWVAVGAAALIALVLPRIMPVSETKLQEALMLALVPVLCLVIYKLW